MLWQNCRLLKYRLYFSNEAWWSKWRITRGSVGKNAGKTRRQTSLIGSTLVLLILKNITSNPPCCCNGSSRCSQKSTNLVKQGLKHYKVQRCHPWRPWENSKHWNPKRTDWPSTQTVHTHTHTRSVTLWFHRLAKSKTSYSTRVMWPPARVWMIEQSQGTVAGALTVWRLEENLVTLWDLMYENGEVRRRSLFVCPVCILFWYVSLDPQYVVPGQRELKLSSAVLLCPQPINSASVFLCACRASTNSPPLMCCWAERSVLPLPPAAHTVCSSSRRWLGSVAPGWRYSEEFSGCHSTPGRTGSPGKSRNNIHI